MELGRTAPIAHAADPLLDRLKPELSRSKARARSRFCAGSFVIVWALPSGPEMVVSLA